MANPKFGACPCFKVGDTFLLKRTSEQDDFYHLMNGRFCGEAWDAVSRYVHTALQGGSVMHKWTNNERMMIACCNNGTRPVIFKIERIDISETELFHLYDIDFKDCRSCFACKLKSNKTNGICAIEDGLRPVCEKIMDADGLIIGSPIYYGNLTGETISFLNRLFFPAMHYRNDGVKPVKKPKKCGLIMTMNVPETDLDAAGFEGTRP